MQYKQYTFMQIQKEIECSGQFNDFIELEFKFKDLDEELSDHETYNGIDNFTKYFIKVHMKYQSGSIVSGSNLEKLHEFEVRNYYRTKLQRKKMEEQKALQATQADSIGALDQIPASLGGTASYSQQDQFGFDDPHKYETDSAIPLDQTFDNQSQYSDYKNNISTVTADGNPEFRQ